ncbi:MAG: hypothetical protein ACKVPX_00650 [Myxococcaceae bacterium]
MLLLAPVVARAQTTLVLQPGPAVGRDLSLSFDGSTLNRGASDDLEGYGDFQRVALLWFDLSSVPGGASCTSADLTLWYLSVEPDVVAVPGRAWTAYELLPANGGWIEGTGFGGPTAPGESDRMWIISPTSRWASGDTVYGFNSADVDSTPLATFPVPNLPLPGDAISFSLPCSVVERWFGPTPQNPGIGLTVNEYTGIVSAHHLVSSDHLDSTRWPRLSVTYLASPPPDGGASGGDGGVENNALGPMTFTVGCACQGTPIDPSILGAMALLPWLRRRTRATGDRRDRLAPSRT